MEILDHKSLSSALQQYAQHNTTLKKDGHSEYRLIRTVENERISYTCEKVGWVYKFTRLFSNKSTLQGKLIEDLKHAKSSKLIDMQKGDTATAIRVLSERHFEEKYQGDLKELQAPHAQNQKGRTQRHHSTPRNPSAGNKVAHPSSPAQANTGPEATDIERRAPPVQRQAPTPSVKGEEGKKAVGKLAQPGKKQKPQSPEQRQAKTYEEERQEASELLQGAVMNQLHQGSKRVLKSKDEKIRFLSQSKNLDRMESLLQENPRFLLYLRARMDSSEENYGEICRECRLAGTLGVMFTKAGFNQSGAINHFNIPYDKFTLILNSDGTLNEVIFDQKFIDSTVKKTTLFQSPEFRKKWEDIHRA